MSSWGRRLLGLQPRLHKAVATGDIAKVRKLLAEGADVMERDKNGLTPLHVAATVARPEMTTLLLEHGADVNARDGGGHDPALLGEADSTSNGAHRYSRPPPCPWGCGVG